MHKADSHKTWQILSSMLVILLHSQIFPLCSQYPFNHISPSYSEEIPPELIDQLHEALNYTNVSMFLECLFEYILLGVKDMSQPGSRQTDEDDMTDTEFP